MSVNHQSPGTALRWAVLTALAAGCLAVAVTRLADPWTPPGLPAADGPEAARSRRLDEQLRVASCRSTEEERLAQDVAAGRLGLVEAAGRFRDLAAEDPVLNPEAFRRTYPGDTDEERYCRQVIRFVQLSLGEQPGADPAVAGRLEAELQDRLRRGGLRLPGPARGGPGEAPARVGEKVLDAREGVAGRDRGDETVYAGGK
jgi:hypothetical protein